MGFFISYFLTFNLASLTSSLYSLSMIQLKNIEKSYTSHAETITLFTDLDWSIEK